MKFSEYLKENDLGVRADVCCLSKHLCDKRDVIFKALMNALDNDEKLVCDVMRKLDIETDNYAPLALGKSSAEDINAPETEEVEVEIEEE